MKTRNRKSGYSANTATEYIDNKQAIYCLSTELEPQIRFEDNQPTGVKFNSEVTLPPYMAMVTFDNLQACEVGYNVYFKADELKEIK